MISVVLVLLTPVAIFFSVVYLIELALFLKSLKNESPELWVEMGSPTFSRATHRAIGSVLFWKPQVVGRLNGTQRSRGLRLRVYLIGLLLFYGSAIIVLGFGRQFGVGVA